MIDFIHFAHAATEAAVEAGARESAGAIGSLGINLKLFIAQLVNFGIILLVLWKWVFTPVAKKLTARTERVEKAMRDASNTEKAKNEFFQWKETEMARVRSQTTAIITSAQNEAAKAKQQIMDETKKEQEKVIQQAKVKIEEEKNSAVREVKSQMADLVTLASEKILRKKLDEHQDEELIKESLKTI
ncbi:MAG: F0F1 ATP synthase subunit B [Candidatus Doudnabacteria bacterium]|nr:F0F1 ATP synthase subunit B [Candidatus Doudnabacteria bacterium]